MLDAVPELRSKDFDTWVAAVRPRLEASFGATYQIDRDQARAIVDRTITLAGEFWDVVSMSDSPHVWAYRTTMKRADELFGAVGE